MPAVYTQEMLDKLKAGISDDKVRKKIDEMKGKEVKPAEDNVDYTPGEANVAWYIAYKTTAA